MIRCIGLACLLAACTTDVTVELDLGWSATRSPSVSRVTLEGVEVPPGVPTSVVRHFGSYTPGTDQAVVEVTVGGVVETMPIELGSGCGDDVVYIETSYQLSGDAPYLTLAASSGGCCHANGDCDRWVY